MNWSFYFSVSCLQTYRRTFPFAEVPIQLPNELAIAEKHNASVETIKTFAQRRCLYAQLLPNQPFLQPFNQTEQAMEPQHKPETQKSVTMTKLNQKRNSMAIAGIARSMGINGQNAATDKRTKQQGIATHNQNLLQIPKINNNSSFIQNSMPS